MSLTNKKNLEGIKHLLQCHCILPQYKNSKNPVFHQFVVFSVLDKDSDTVQLKYAECNNCSAVHKVVDICKSEIVIGKDEVTSQLSISDLKYALPSSLFELLQTYDREISDFEYAQFILENEMWDKYIILTREEINNETQGKLVRFILSDKFRVESYTARSLI